MVFCISIPQSLFCDSSALKNEKLFGKDESVKRKKKMSLLGWSARISCSLSIPLRHVPFLDLSSSTLLASAACSVVRSVDLLLQALLNPSPFSLAYLSIKRMNLSHAKADFMTYCASILAGFPSRKEAVTSVVCSVPSSSIR